MKRLLVFLFFIPLIIIGQTKDSLLSANKSKKIVITSDVIRKYPDKDIKQILSSIEGISLYNNKLYMQGGRENEISFQMNGLPLTELMGGGTPVSLPYEAIEQVEIGGAISSAEFGSGRTNYINYSLKRGSKSFKTYVNYGTDNIAVSSSNNSYNGNKHLGAYSYGYNYLTVSVSGEAVDDIYYYFLLNQSFMRDRTPSAFPELKGHIGAYYNYYNPLDFDFAGGLIRNNSSENNSIISNFNYDMSDMQLQLSVVYQYGNSYDGVTSRFRNIFNYARNPLTEYNSLSGTLSLKHKINENLSYEITAGYNSYFTEIMDPVLRDDYFHYLDSNKARELGYDMRHSFWNHLPFNALYKTDGIYSKNLIRSLNLKSIFTIKSLLPDSIKIGFELNKSSIRMLKADEDYMYYYNGIIYSKTQPKEEFQFLEGGNVYGYDFKGNMVDEDSPYGPRKPFWSALFFQNDFSVGNLSASIGLRGDYFDQNNYKIDLKYLFSGFGSVFTKPDVNKIEKTGSYINLNPRILLNYQFNDDKIISAGFSSYTQIPKYSDIYEGLYEYTSIISEDGTPFYVSPEREPSKSSVAELSFFHKFSNQFNYKITGMLKTISNLPTMYNTIYNPYFLSGYGQTDVKTITIAAEYNPVKNLLFRFNSTFNFTKGVTLNYFNSQGNYVNSRFLISTFTDVPLEAYPDFLSNIFLNYSTGSNFRQIGLDDISITATMQIHSGYYYTKAKTSIGFSVPQRENLEYDLNGSETGWFYQLDLQIEKQFWLANKILSQFYISIINLFDIKNDIKRFLNTGSPDNDGHKSAGSYSYYSQLFGTDYVKLLEMQEKYNSAFNYGPPRQIRVGLKLNF